MTKPLQKSADRVSYSESVKVNIGDYESRDIFVNYASDVKETEDFEDALHRVRSKVRAELASFERLARSKSQEHVDFNTMSKLESAALVKKKKKKRK